MPRMRARTVVRQGRVRPITWGDSVPVRDQQPQDRAVIARAHKERILQLLLDEPSGLALADLAAALELGRDRTYDLVDELHVEGRIGKLGGSRHIRWIANV